MANLAAAGSGHTANLANGIRWKVVVEHEAFLLLTLIAFEPLRVIAGAKCCRDERLRFTPCKEC